MTKLSVNINKIATIRNARGGSTPNVIEAAINCEKYGAQGITVHPRPDERHITTRDAYELAEVVTTEYNIEGYPDARFMKMVKEIRPAQATLVPDPPGVLTSNAGWNTREHQELLKRLVEELKAEGIRTSVFVDTDPVNIEYAAKCGTDRIELYTGPYAEHFERDKNLAIGPFEKAAQLAGELNLGLNAGHDLNQENLRFFHERISHLLEVSIGHALISDALYLGLENTIQRYLFLLK